MVPAGDARRAWATAASGCGDDRRRSTGSRRGPPGTRARRKAVLGAEHEGEAAKRELLSVLRAALVTPLEPEDVFALSRGVDRILNYARDLVNESEAMDCRRMPGSRRWRTCSAWPCGTSTTRSRASSSDGDEATASADAAITAERQLEQRLLRGHGRAARSSRTAASASRVASSTAAARGSAKPWSRSPSASSTRS